MTTFYAKHSLDWAISMGVHIKSDKLARNGWKWHILAMNSVSSQNYDIKGLRKQLLGKAL